VPEDEIGDGGDQSFLIGTTDEEDGAGSHGLSNVLYGNWGICVVPDGTFVACALY
jgi:hypothetical protein